MSSLLGSKTKRDLNLSDVEKDDSNENSEEKVQNNSGSGDNNVFVTKIEKKPQNIANVVDLKTEDPSLSLDTELLRVEMDKGIYGRLLKNQISGEYYMDLRRFYKTYPTKKGIRLKYNVFRCLYDKVNSYYLKRFKSV
jgi:hypothetical protein